MRLRAVLIVAAGLVVAADAPKGDLTKQDRDKLQGKWQMIRATAEFNQNSVELLPVVNALVRTSLEIAGDKLTVSNKSADKQLYTIAVDATKKPKTIDLSAEPKKERKILGVYELEGDVLRICVAAASVRPVECKAHPASLFLIFQREKPAVVQAPPVSFPDKNLEQAVREALHEPKADLTKERLANLYVLETSHAPIRNLTGLEECKNLALLKLAKSQVSELKPLTGLTNLQSLDLSGNKIADVTPLSSLTKLQYLDLSNNAVASVAPLSGLNALFALYLANNQVRDITPIGNLAKLSSLSLAHNQVQDLAPLLKVTRLTTLDLNDNQVADLKPLNKQAELSLLMLERNKIADLAPLVGMAKADAEGPKRFAPYLRLYLAGNPLSEEAKTKQLAALKSYGVRIESK
jgi:internalin A